MAEPEANAADKAPDGEAKNEAGDTMGSSPGNKKKTAIELLKEKEAEIGESPEDIEILERLQKLHRKPKQKKSIAWDGRATGISLQEYKERKWSMDACFNRTVRAPPGYTMRPMVSFGSMLNNKGGNGVHQRGDVHKALHATKYRGPSFSMGALPLLDEKGKSPGPAEYKVKSTMDPNSHPVHSKALGARFGTEQLECADSTSVPGPGQYDLEGYENSSVYAKKPNWVIEGREAWNDKTAAPNPGPGEYQYFHTMRNGKITNPRYTAQGKTMPIEPPRGVERLSPVPPPGSYNPPANPGCKNHHVDRHKPPEFSVPRESRGLI